MSCVIMQNENNGNWVTKLTTSNWAAGLIFRVKKPKVRVNKATTISYNKTKEKTIVQFIKSEGALKQT